MSSPSEGHSSKPLYIGVALATVPVISITLFLMVHREDTPRDLVTNAINNHDVDYAYASTLAHLTAPFIAKTRFDGHVNTSSAPINGDLNLYVLRSPDRYFKGLRCNCAYVGWGIVACDKAFLDSFSHALDFTIKAPSLDKVLKQVDADAAKWLTSWLIGHELGHAILHDATGAYTRDLALHRPFLTKAQEEQADRYFVDRVPRPDRNRLSFTLANFAFNTISASYVQSAMPHHAGEAVIKPSADGVHPPWLVRAITLSTEVDSLNGAGRRSYFPELAKLVTLDPKGFDVGSFCQAEKLRDLALDRMKHPRHAN